jgi:hypothetical protein
MSDEDLSDDEDSWGDPPEDDESYKLTEEEMEETLRIVRANPGWDYWEDRPKLALVADRDGDEQVTGDDRAGDGAERVTESFDDPE